MQSPQAIAALGALAHDARLAVFRLLVQAGPEGMPAGGIAEQLALAPSGLTFHLKELTAAGLLLRHPDGRQVRYSADYTTMTALMAYLASNCCRGETCALDAQTGCAVNAPELPRA